MRIDPDIKTAPRPRPDADEPAEGTPHLRLYAGGAGGVAEHVSPAVLPTGPTPGAPAEPPTFERLFGEHARFVAQVALRILGRDAEVDDVVQEVFLCALTDLGKLRQGDAVRGWLKTITVRKAYRVLRRRRLRAWLGLDDPAWRNASALDVPAPGCDPEGRSLLLRVYRLLDELPAADRLAWTLRYVEGEQLEAVATLCGCSLATAKRRIASAQSFMERMVSDV